MTHIETNAFPILNLEELNCNYRIYKVRGLSPDVDEFHKNKQFLADELSRHTHSPCYVFTENDSCYIAQPDGFRELPETYQVVRATVKIEKEPKTRTLRFDSKNPFDIGLIERFLQFSLQNPLYNNPSLWQPKSGYPYYYKQPDNNIRRLSGTIDMYNGFKFRVIFADNTISLCIDTANKYASREPLPTKISRDDFNRKYKHAHCVYEYGHTWYEFKIDALSDLTANEVQMPFGISLFQEVHRAAGSNKSSNLLSLPSDCSVLIYKKSLGEQRSAPSGLCRLTYSTEHPEIKPIHRRSLKSAQQRRDAIRYIVDKYFRNISFNSVPIKLSEKAVSIKPNQHGIRIPALRFGKGNVLSVGDPRNGCVTLSSFPEKKKELFYSTNAGMYNVRNLFRQYFVLPRSVYETHGPAFIEDLKAEVNILFANAGSKTVYDPIPVPYNDSVHSNVPNMAKAIFKAMAENAAESGYGIVMIPRLRSRRFKEDELANLIMREMRKRDIYVSIIHTAVSQEHYGQRESSNGEKIWQISSPRERRGAIKGYLKGVALNKVLLLNNLWPFILDSGLNADLTMGIDVKNNVAGFTFIYKTGADIRFFSSSSNDKEQLSRDHIRAKILECLEQEKEIIAANRVKNIVIHRQGRLFPVEQKGIEEALASAARRGFLDKSFSCTFTEIQFSSQAPMRLFRVKNIPESQREVVTNPAIGTYFLANGNEGYLCNTGFPYNHEGTTKPIRVSKIHGAMAFEEILEDVFSLANLTWTKIDDCSRYPLSIKMNDIRLREIAGEYGEDAYKFADEEIGGEADE